MDERNMDTVALDRPIEETVTAAEEAVLPEVPVEEAETLQTPAAEAPQEALTEEAAPQEAPAEEAPAEEEVPAEKNYKVSKRTGILLICGSIAVGALAVLAAYKGRELRRAKAGARRSIAYTDVDLYDKADRRRIRKLEKRSMRKVDKARTRNSVRSAMDAYDDSLDGFQTCQEKLSEEKLDAITEAYESLLKEKTGARAAAAAVSKVATAAGADSVARAADVVASRGASEDEVREYVEDIRSATDSEQVKKLRRKHRFESKKHISGKF